MESGTALLCLNGPEAGLMVGMADIAPPGYVIEGPDTFTFYDDFNFNPILDPEPRSLTLTYPARYVYAP